MAARGRHCWGVFDRNYPIYSVQPRQSLCYWHRKHSEVNGDLGQNSITIYTVRHKLSIASIVS